MVTFTEGILNGKLQFLCSDGPDIQTNNTQEQGDFFTFRSKFHRAFVQKKIWMDHESTLKPYCIFISDFKHLLN